MRKTSSVESCCVVCIFCWVCFILCVFVVLGGGIFWLVGGVFLVIKFMPDCNSMVCWFVVLILNKPDLHWT